MVKGINLAEKNPNWKGGVNTDYYLRIAYETYPKECAICKDNKNLEVHHKDRNRRNNRVKNLIILCRTCHKKTHSNLNGWSRQYNQCKQCGTDKIKHNAKGFCIKCYDSLFVDKSEYYYANRDKINQKKREKYHTDKEFREKKLKYQRDKNKTQERKEYLKEYHKQWYLRKKKKPGEFK